MNAGLLFQVSLKCIKLPISKALLLPEIEAQEGTKWIQRERLIYILLYLS